MNNEQIRNFFEKKEIEETPCYLTEELVNGGFKQKSGGYIGYAKERNIVNPTQYWHLIEGWCNQKKDNAIFNKRIQCGELIFWMAEVSKAVEFVELQKLKDEILKDYLNRRSEGNRKIQEVCFDKIVSLVEKSYLK